MQKRVGLIGFGRIGSYLYERCLSKETIGVDFIYDPDRSRTASLPRDIVLEKPQDVLSRKVDLVVEAANPKVVRDYAPSILAGNDLLILSVTALAEEDVYQRVTLKAVENKSRIYIPHGALLGMDGIHDARHTLEKVEITTVKNPRNIDFDSAGNSDLDGIKNREVLYDGSTRGICAKFPRNVNAHAILALAGIGFDQTRSKLIADPFCDDAVQHIIAEGQGITIEIRRSSPIKGVTGDYTLASIYGSMERALSPSYGINIL